MNRIGLIKLEKIKLINKLILSVLIITSILNYSLFTFLTINKYTFNNLLTTNILNNKEELVNLINNASHIQSASIILTLLPNIVITVVILIVLFIFEKKSKERSSNYIIQLIFALFLSYSMFVNIFDKNFFMLMIFKTQYSPILTIAYLLVFIFSIYYTIYKGAFLILSIRKNKGEIFNNYRIFYYPFLAIVLIYLIYNIVQNLILIYIAKQILNAFSISSLISLSEIINIPLDISLANFLPPYIQTILLYFNVPIDITLNSVGITKETLNSMFDNLVLNNIDMYLDKYILNIISGFILTNIINFIICLVAVIGSCIVEYINKDKYYYNIIFTSISLVSILFISSFFLNVFKVGFLISLTMFIYIIVFDDRKRTKEIIDFWRKK